MGEEVERGYEPQVVGVKKCGFCSQKSRCTRELTAVETVCARFLHRLEPDPIPPLAEELLAADGC